MKQNENTIAPIDLKRSMQIKFHDHSWLFHLSLKKKKTGRCREVILAVGDTVAVVERWTIVEVGLYQGRTLESLNLTKLAE